MSSNKLFIPYTHLVLEKAINEAKVVSDDEGRKIRSYIDKVILEDEEVSEKINSLSQELKLPPPEPIAAITFRAVLRPTITLVLTVTFIILVLGQTGILVDAPDDPTASKIFFERWDRAFTIFLAIYGPIIGFWFGERTVERKSDS